MSIKNYKNQFSYQTLCLFFFLIQTIPNFAQGYECINFSLAQAIEYATENSPTYQNAKLDVTSTKAKKKEIMGMGLPQVNASADLKTFLTIPTSLFPGSFFNQPGYIKAQMGLQYNSTAGFEFSQLLYSSDFLIGNIAAKQMILLANINLNKNTEELFSTVSKAYFTTLVNNARLSVIEANLERVKKLHNDLKVMNQQGLVELIDVERIEVQLNNLYVEKNKMTQFLALSEKLLKFHMGIDFRQPIKLTDQLNSNINSMLNLKKNEDYDITQRTDFQAISSQQKLLQLDAKRHNLNYIPTLVAYGAYQANGFGADFGMIVDTKNWFNTTLVGVKMSVNLFDGFQKQYKIKQSKIELLKTENNIKILEKAADMEVETVKINYNSAVESIRVHKKNLALAESVVNMSRKKFNEGIGSNLELINAESALKETQTNYLNAIYELLIADIDYKKATGVLLK